MALAARTYPERVWVTVVEPDTLEPLRMPDAEDEARLGMMRFPVAGTGFRLKEAASPAFAPGSLVRIETEPRNRHDRRAIAVRSADGKLTAGYVPRPDASSTRDHQARLHRVLSGGPVQGAVLEGGIEQGARSPYVSMWVPLRIQAAGDHPEKQKRYDEALQVVSRADEQGWAGDWDTRVQRLRRKL